MLSCEIRAIRFTPTRLSGSHRVPVAMLTSALTRIGEVPTLPVLTVPSRGSKGTPC